ncbi:glycosyltransferase family 4 protein [Polaribacter sp. Z022]|uniref:glycosyltransferase family 4 protein n=1 Tax=Polaribacter sp. Z022 TaxID=2927125 RepID=UPI0020214AF0|nr:glycosyltransferase family 4 protein [Polaribacter sp. Z022]MCL7752801.1 glycosyltransferase family 4 protein [Polaribacter sp. Z022]
MKISIINTLYPPYTIGGAEKSVQALAENFLLLGHEVSVITLGEKTSVKEINNVSVNTLKIENIYFPFKEGAKSTTQKIIWHTNDVNNKKYDKNITAILKSFNPDVLFTNNISGFSTRVWKIARKMNIKTIHTLRDYYLQCPKTTKFKNKKNCDKLCFDCKLLSIRKKEDSHNVDFLIGISNFILKDHICNGYFKNVPNKVIYNGFDSNVFKDKSPKNTIVFGYIGQINKSKGVELLLKSFLKLNKYKWKLLIAGNIDQDYLNYLKTINNSNNIEFLGYVKSDLFYDKINVLVVPSLWNEPFGRVVLESIINNKPVLGSNKGGISELLSNNKDFLFCPNENELANLLKKTILNTSFLSLFKFDESFIENFMLKNTVKQYLDVFNEVIKNN